MLVKIHNSYRNIVAICDKELIGKSFEEGNRAIVLNEAFFGGEKKSEKEVMREIQLAADEDATFNIVGERSINAALKTGLIKESGIIKINNIPVALVLL